MGGGGKQALYLLSWIAVWPEQQQVQRPEERQGVRVAGVECGEDGRGWDVWLTAILYLCLDGIKTRIINLWMFPFFTSLIISASPTPLSLGKTYSWSSWSKGREERELLGLGWKEYFRTVFEELSFKIQGQRISAEDEKGSIIVWVHPFHGVWHKQVKGTNYFEITLKCGFSLNYMNYIF